MDVNQPEPRNSAGRLLALFESIPKGKPLLEILPPLIGINTKNQQEKQQAALAFLMEMHKVYLEFRQDMLDATINEQQRDTMLSGLVSLEQSLYPIQLNAGFREVTEAEKSLLKVCATFIVEEGPITEDDIEAIRNSIAELRTKVEDGSISPTLRKALLELIRLSEDAISRFNIHGARGLKRAFKAMLADAAELYGMTDPERDREELKKSSVWSAIVKHLRTVDAVASRLLKYGPLLTGASQLLIGGPPDAPAE
ncbi:MAG TPA: hypothetical protein VMY37_27765 [Thermoguttaceae bacterium]|nr:hypothetical protein [Thermoguttaceae bacterium]